MVSRLRQVANKRDDLILDEERKRAAAAARAALADLSSEEAESDAAE